MRPIDGNAHIEDGELARLLGDELAGHERARVAGHIDRCDACAARVATLQAEMDDVAGLLAGLDGPALDTGRRERSLAAVRQAASRSAAAGRTPAAVPMWRRRRTFLTPSLARAAAIVGLLVAGGVAASPAGAWLVDRVRDLIQPAQPEAVAEPESTPVPARSSAVAFTPVGDALLLELRSAQEHGQLVVRIEDVTVATARVSGGDGELDFVVLPGMLRIENHPEAVTRYDVTVPAHLERLTVRVGDAEAIELRPAELGAGWSSVIGLRHGTAEVETDGL
jgi:hypothetical protein